MNHNLNNTVREDGLSKEDFDKQVSKKLKFFFPPPLSIGKKGIRLAEKLYKEGYTPKNAAGLIVLNFRN